MSDKVIIQKFREIFTGPSPYLGRLQGATVCADALACRGSKDHLYLYARIVGDRIEEVKFECGRCDPEMFVTADIVCRLIHGRRVSELAYVDWPTFSAALGFESEDMQAHFEGARRVLDALVEHHWAGKPCEF
jgi:NifU-like protein involved in Fe-S cluster formation